MFVGNLAYPATKDEVRALFAKAGRVTDIFFPRADPAGGKINSGMAFVEMATPEEAAAAILLINNTEGPYGRTVFVKSATPH